MAKDRLIINGEHSHEIMFHGCVFISTTQTTYQLQEWKDEFVSGEMEVMNQQTFASSLDTLKWTFLIRFNKRRSKIKTRVSKFMLKNYDIQ